MEAQELRAFNVEELKGRVKQWRDELFRAKFKAQSSEAKDTSIFRKLRKDIARGETILNEKLRALATTDLKEVKAPTDKVAPKAKKAKTVTAEASAAPESSEKKPAKKAKTAAKSKTKE